MINVIRNIFSRISVVSDRLPAEALKLLGPHNIFMVYKFVIVFFFILMHYGLYNVYVYM